jgi:hypothetical protein
MTLPVGKLKSISRVVPQAILTPFDSFVQPGSDTSPHLLEDQGGSVGEM